MAKNYTRETTAKDAFSLWEHENPELVESLNKKIKECEHNLQQYFINNGPSFRKFNQLMDILSSAIIDLHCKFEDWCFEDRPEEPINKNNSINHTNFTGSSHEFGSGWDHPIAPCPCDPDRD